MTNKRINKCGKHLYWWKNSIPLGFYTQKSLIIHRCLHKLTSVFRPFGRLDISYQLNFIIRRIHLMKTKRVPTQVHTRKLDRMVARKNMEKKGVTQINKIKGDASFFSKNWRDYVTI